MYIRLTTCYGINPVQVQRSHRVIEKKRRDKINTCLAQLTRAVPAAAAKQVNTTSHSVYCCILGQVQSGDKPCLFMWGTSLDNSQSLPNC